MVVAAQETNPDLGNEMEAQMQHVLAGIITKILGQKSIRESVANLHTLVIDELEGQIRDTPKDS